MLSLTDMKRPGGILRFDLVGAVWKQIVSQILKIDVRGAWRVGTLVLFTDTAQLEQYKEIQLMLY